jgi:hypothetical protein
MDTDLVQQLRTVGIPQRQAAALERALDDRPAAGISGVMLGRLICAVVRQSLEQYRHAIELQDAIAERRRLTQLDLFHSSMYGTHVGADEG